MSEFYFSAYQIAEMAMKIEEAGARFYTQLANKVGAEELKKFFSILAQAEREHRKAFAEIADNFRQEETKEYSIDLMGLMQVQIEKLKEAVFNPISSVKNPNDILEAINIAIEVEKEAIRIFTEVCNSFVDKFHAILENIISEEKKHLEMLLNIKNKLGFKK